jgi:hypothetical protein
MRDLLRNPQPSKTEMFFALGMIGAVVLGIGYIDSVLFDTYVKPDMVDDSWQLTGQPYQEIMGGLLLAVAVGLGVFRIVSGKLAGAKTSIMLFLTGALWSGSALIFHNTGFTDYLYYRLRGMEIPTPLDWLDTIGLFQWTRFLVGGEHVDPGDLYITMIIGLLLFMALWLTAIHHYSKRKMGRLTHAL